MIDWVTAIVPMRSADQLFTGEVSCVGPDSELEWVARKRMKVSGSHSSTISVRATGDGCIEFAGSPAKFLQGHNLFGTDCLRSVGGAMILQACRSARIKVSDFEERSILAGEYLLKRVDINYSFSTGSRANVLAWIGKAAAVGTLQNRGRGKLHGSSTAMWGEGSRYWKLKAYSKGAEIAARITSFLQVSQCVPAWRNGAMTS